MKSNADGCPSGNGLIALNSGRSRSVPVRGDLDRGLDESAAATGDRILREQLGGHRLRFTDDQRRRLANGLWMKQTARKLTYSVNGLLMGKRWLIKMGTRCSRMAFLRTLKDAGVESVKLPARSPNVNAHPERFVRSIKESCLERLILFEESSLRTAVQDFVAHCHSERNHQGLSNRLILPDPAHPDSAGGRLITHHTYGQPLLDWLHRVDPWSNGIPIQSHSWT